MEAIKCIKAEFKNISIDEYEAFINEYSGDERDQVKELVQRAQKRIDALNKEKERMVKMFEFERKYSDYEYICGVDEVGRGPLAGPVVAGAVILPKDCNLLYLNDSKRLTEKKREELYDKIMDTAVAAAVGFADNERVDEINVLQADYEAMKEAIGLLSVKPSLLLNDAVEIPGIDISQVPIIKGDAKSASIAAASIIAKVTRDRLMLEYDSLYPQYRFASNKGYGSQEHIEAIKKYGPCPIHRKTFITHFV